MFVIENGSISRVGHYDSTVGSKGGSQVVKKPKRHRREEIEGWMNKTSSTCLTIKLGFC